MQCDINIKYINKNFINLIFGYFFTAAILIIAAYKEQEYIFAKIHIVQFYIDICDSLWACMPKPQKILIFGHFFSF